MESILKSILKLLGPEEDYDHFDPDVILHINSALMRLRQLGVGPKTAFSIHGMDETWYEFMPNIEDYEQVKQYVYISVKLIFDPPTSSGHISALEKRKDELEWLLCCEGETPTTEV